MLKPKVVLLIFVSGKIVLTGAKVKLEALFSLIAIRLRLIRPGETIVDTITFFPPCRFEKRFTRPSTLFTRCCASSGSRDAADCIAVLPLAPPCPFLSIYFTPVDRKVLHRLTTLLARCPVIGCCKWGGPHQKIVTSTEGHGRGADVVHGHFPSFPLYSIIRIHVQFN